jgi:hypothetical protein
MPKYVIEREVPGAGQLNGDELQGISEKSNEVLLDMGGDVQWVHSYVTEDKIYCVYNAPSAERVREHARRTGFPADSVSRVASIIDPISAEARVSA